MLNREQGLRVVHVYRTYFPETQGGLQEAIRQICRATAKVGVENSVFTLAKNPVPKTLHTEEAQVQRGRCVVEIASCDIGSPAVIFQFRRLVREVDLLHFHYPWPFGDVLGLLGGGAKPFVVTYHSDIVRQRLLEGCYAPIRALFFRRAARIITTSPAYQAGSQFLRAIRRPVETIPLCLDEFFVPAVDSALVDVWRKRIGNVFFLFVGVLRYYKGLDYLVQAAIMTGLPVVIAGEGPEKNRLRALGGRYSNIHFVGHVDDTNKYALLDACRAVVFPSHLRSEAFGVTLLEGAIRKKPLISTEIGTGTSYVNQDGVTGFVVPPANSERLAAAMKQLAENAEMAERMGKASYLRYQELFSAQAVGERYRALYQDVVTQHRSASV